jgi:hypothetical protein
MTSKAPVPPPGQYIIIAGTILGIIAGCALIFVSPIKGAIPGAFFGIGGAVAGVLISRPIALAVNKRLNK